MARLRSVSCFVIVLLAGSLSCDQIKSKSPGPIKKQAREGIVLPSGWRSKPNVKNEIQFAGLTGHEMYFQLMVEPKIDFADRIGLLEWAELVRKNSAKESTLINRKDTELRKRTVGERQTVEYEVTGELESGLKLHFRSIMVESGSDYCKLVCWTTPSEWEAAQVKFDELVSRIK